jgi:hypothetical protein
LRALGVPRPRRGACSPRITVFMLACVACAVGVARSVVFAFPDATHYKLALLATLVPVTKLALYEGLDRPSLG